jgi:uncharacterized protein
MIKPNSPSALRRPTPVSVSVSVSVSVTMTTMTAMAICGASIGIPASAQAAPERIVTAAERGTYIQIGRDLARLVAQPAGITLEAVPSKGSTENVRRLRQEPGVRLALVQSDVVQAFMDEARNGNNDALQMIKPLRVVMPLYDEEIHFVTRADSPLASIHEMRDKRINVGPVGSGTALTATTLYRQMFGTAIAERNASYMSNEDALRQLVTDSSIDVVVIVTGQPAKIFADMRPEARQFIKLLRLDTQAAPSQAAMATYAATSIRASSYPNWLSEDVPALTTKAMLVTYDYQSSVVQNTLTRFARSLCTNFERLKADGHAKWQEVSLDLPPLGRNWNYYAPTERELVACNAGRRQAARASGAALPGGAGCSQAQNVLGLCRPTRAQSKLGQASAED